MSLYTKTNFTSSQGIVHAAAVFGIAYATSFSRNNQTYRRGNPDYADISVTEDKELNVNVQYYYWADQAALDNGMDPFILINRKMNEQGELLHVGMSFDFEASDVIYEGMTLEQMCLHYLENVALA